jgi:hypothetical protein
MLPALTWPTGSTPVKSAGKNYNMSSDTNAKIGPIEIPGLMANKHIWPNIDDGIYIWKHSDVRNMAYCFTYKVFERIVELSDPPK